MVENSNRQGLFDSWSTQYDRDVNDGGFPFMGYDRTLNALIEAGDFQNSHKVLDVGIGTGNLSARLALPEAQIWGIDFSKEMLLKAKEALPGSHLFQLDLLAQEWPAVIVQPFNRIVSGYTFHEFPDESKVGILHRLASGSLAPDGVILIADISFPDSAKFQAAEYHFQKEGCWDEEEFYWCADAMLTKLEAEGFQAEYMQISPCSGIYRLLLR